MDLFVWRSVCRTCAWPIPRSIRRARWRWRSVRPTLGAAVALFPELGISAYSNDDLFHQDALLEASVRGMAEVVAGSRSLTPCVIVGAPLRL